MATHYAGTPREKRALNAFIALSRAAESVAGRLDRALEARGLSHGQLGVLEALLHLGPLYQRELARKLLRSPASITAVLDSLEERGLVERRRGLKDRRLFTVHLTREGRGHIQGLFPGHVAEIVAAMEALSPGELEELRCLCRKLGLAMEAGAGGTGPRRKAARK